LHKTGSSTIQETLIAARDRLGDLAYLTDGTHANASLWVRNAFMSDKRLAAIVGSDGDAAAVRAQARRKFDEACSTAARAARAVLSAEAISNLQKHRLMELHNALTLHWSDIVYVGYLREPVSYARSAFQQRLKTSDQGFPFGEGAPLRLNYHHVIEDLDTIVGRDAVHVFPFERAHFPGGDVVRHFLEFVAASEGEVPTRHVNEGLSATAVKALFAYRRLRVKNDAQIGQTPSRQAFVAALAEIAGPAFALDPAIEERILAANAHILDWANERMGATLRPAPTPADGHGVREEADMLRFTDTELAELSRWAETLGLRGPAAGAGAEGVADLLADVRSQLAAGSRRTRA
jgi:hypothetical protein